ncbi:VOC family protein [Paractinoplanes hotanensis]|uniref:VOC family protein n=1 Tax=Paractinoplanes hotanensis TaxID=2906497 RepID=A0ABT0YEC1_9ACTN|nr:VOC family protein [Actinoplanes hotanensis]MCM4084400.1 VOC family protein [Actinoplanes hotanensis]
MADPVVHWEIGGRDLTALSAFYSKAFGWTVRENQPGYAMVQPVDGGLGGGLMQSREGMPPYVTIYVQVDDLENALRLVSELGGATLVPPTPISTESSFALFRDPEGNAVGLLQASGPLIGESTPTSG